MENIEKLCEECSEEPWPVSFRRLGLATTQEEFGQPGVYNKMTVRQFQQTMDIGLDRKTLCLGFGVSPYYVSLPSWPPLKRRSIVTGVTGTRVQDQISEVTHSLGGIDPYSS
jgi:hypothetical protein